MIIYNLLHIIYIIEFSVICVTHITLHIDFQLLPSSVCVNLGVCKCVFYSTDWVKGKGITSKYFLFYFYQSIYPSICVIV